MNNLKRNISLANRYFLLFETLKDIIDLNDHYHLDFVENLKKLVGEGDNNTISDSAKKIKTRKVGERPLSRKVGERPLKPVELVNQYKIQRYKEEEKLEFEFNKEESSWRKKILRKIYLEVHPDRLVNKNEEEKLEKRKIRNYIISDKSNVTIISSALVLGIDIKKDISFVRQEKIIRQSIELLKKDISDTKERISWLWGESTNNSEKKELVKFALDYMNIHLPEKYIDEYLHKL